MDLTHGTGILLKKRKSAHPETLGTHMQRMTSEKTGDCKPRREPSGVHTCGHLDLDASPPELCENKSVVSVASLVVCHGSRSGLRSSETTGALRVGAGTATWRGCAAGVGKATHPACDQQTHPYEMTYPGTCTYMCMVSQCDVRPVEGDEKVCF